MRLVIDLQGAQGASTVRGIGRYSRELALAMVRAPRGHDPVILLNESLPLGTAPLADAFRALLPAENVRSWQALPQSAFLAGNPAARRASERIRADVIASLCPDLVHVSSVLEGVGDDAVTTWPSGLHDIATVATFYDAIPLVRREDYIDSSWRHITPWYYRHLEAFRRCEALLAISQSSAQEAAHWIGADPASVFDIRAGYDRAMFYSRTLDANRRDALLKRYGLRPGFVLMVGAGDPRKNARRLVEAYALLPQALRVAHQLVIVGSYQPDELRALLGGMKPADALVLIDYVPDGDLPDLYALCHASVLPSEHEGFGLPALEAMACGAAVIASRTSSLPEVVGAQDALFDPFDVADITRHLRHLLTDPNWHARRIAAGLEQARQFGWDQCASLAWDALEAVAGRRVSPDPARGQAPARLPDALPSRRPTLAFVSPLPPDETGIADYARDLLPDLARHYDITLVTDTGVVGDPVLSALFPVMDAARFQTCGQYFERIVYQVGNSPFHSTAVQALLPCFPGIVVLHDAYIGNIPLVAWRETGDLDAFARAVFASHGWPALAALARGTPDTVVRDFPCSYPVFRDSVGVIQHSRHARDIAAGAYGSRVADQVAIVPLARARVPLPARDEARRTLEIPAASFLCCTFGMQADTKRPDDVLATWAQAMQGDPDAVLAYVGGIAPDLQAQLTAQADRLGIARGRVVFTGRIDETSYRLWLAAADCAIQLRRGTRGESSAAIADCMGAGIAVVANAHGSAAELPADALMLLADDAAVPVLADAVSRLALDAVLRATVARRGLDYARDHLAPMRVAGLYAEAIETAWTRGEGAARMDALASCAMQPGMDLAMLAQSLSASFPVPGPRRLLLDATNMAKCDLGTGIQRVIREIARRVLPVMPDGWQADMVRLDGTRLRHASHLAAHILDLPQYGLHEAPVDIRRGDIIVLMDHHGEVTEAECDVLRRAQRQGAQVVLLAYDILPLRAPQWFRPDVLHALQHWPEQMLGLVDRVLCTAHAVADDIAAWLVEHPAVRRSPIDYACFPLGADFSPAVADPEGGAQSPALAAALSAARTRPTLLMVGTIEPRKGYAQSLAAFEALWKSGEDMGLTIVGKPGWMTEDLCARLRSHPERGRRLHWFEGCDDAALQALYRGHAGVLMASEGEGYGLPLVEAAHYARPVLARALPVFREIAGDGAMWFDGTDPAVLARALRAWHAALLDGALPDIAKIRVLSWDESAACFLRAILPGTSASLRPEVV